MTHPHVSPLSGRYHDRIWDRGAGHRLFDVDGRSYLDFACGVATTSLGHQHPAVTRAIHRQVDRLLHVSAAIGYLEPVEALARAIVDTLPPSLDTVFFANSGAEAVEAALKIARRSSRRPGIVAFSGGFHGRTLAATSVTTSNGNFRAGYEPLLPSVYVAPFPHAFRDAEGDEDAASEQALAGLSSLFRRQIDPESVAAMLIEPVQGEGGLHPAPVGFLRALRKMCDEHGILLIVDEVQCGYGRTGLMWAFESADITPDIVCSAKAIANGLPLSATISAHGLQAQMGSGSHGSTFGGNPVSCAAGIAVLDTIRGEGLLENVRARGAELEDGLRSTMVDCAAIGDVRGRGLMMGVELVDKADGMAPAGAMADSVVRGCLDAGLIVLTCGLDHEVVRFLPPLDVTVSEIEEALTVFRDVVSTTDTTGFRSSTGTSRR
jgi:4-aminobutyrate aminotransferase